MPEVMLPGRDGFEAAGVAGGFALVVGYVCCVFGCAPCCERLWQCEDGRDGEESCEKDWGEHLDCVLGVFVKLCVDREGKDGLS